MAGNNDVEFTYEVEARLDQQRGNRHVSQRTDFSFFGSTLCFVYLKILFEKWLDFDAQNHFIWKIIN